MAHPPAPVMALCCICGAPKPAARGLFCDPRYVSVAGVAPPVGAHFVCGGGEGSCLERHLLDKSREGEAGGVDALGALRCPGHACLRKLEPLYFGPKVSVGALSVQARAASSGLTPGRSVEDGGGARHDLRRPGRQRRCA